MSRWSQQQPYSWVPPNGCGSSSGGSGGSLALHAAPASRPSSSASPPSDWQRGDYGASSSNHPQVTPNGRGSGGGGGSLVLQTTAASVSTSSASPPQDWQQGDIGASSSNDPQARTTLVLRNLPCRVPIGQLIHALNSLGFTRRYDLIYLPSASRTAAALKTNLGYGFVNFLTPEDAHAFRDAFEGYRFPGSRSEKRGSTEFAFVQGFVRSLDTLRTTPSTRERGGFRGMLTFSL
mmetsp:Transcript_39142/g.122042  ORF Transcript_39142/g.122042 Transcript_39142/m.122042 type:complete len:235 (-) Transcript_39142:26-730(-)